MRGEGSILPKLIASFCISFCIILVVGIVILFYWYEPEVQEEQASQVIHIEFKEPEMVPEEEQLNGVDSVEEVDLEEIEQSGIATLVFGGDTLLGTGYTIMSTALTQENGLADSIEGPVLEEMLQADICMINNEFPYTLRGEPVPDKMYTFRGDPAYAAMLHDIGVDVVSLANNHTFDYGEISLLDSLDSLDAAGIDRLGAGKNLEEASKPIYYEINGITVGIVAATEIEGYSNPETRGATDSVSGVYRSFNPEHVEATLTKMEEQADVVVLFIHWGSEHKSEPNGMQLDHAAKFAKAGADVIVGTHSHCMQTIDYVEGVPVAYSLGNFLFDSKDGETALLKVIAKEGGDVEVSLIPCRQGNSRIYAMTKEEKLGFYEYMRSISPNVTISEEGIIKSIDN